MNLVFVVLAVICGGAVALGLVEDVDKRFVVAGIGIVCAGLAAAVPGDFAWFKRG